MQNEVLNLIPHRFKGIVGGVDEVGRGPLAGPVVACNAQAYVESKADFRALEKKLFSLGVGDSKKISELKRKIILEKLKINIFKLHEAQKCHLVLGKYKIQISLTEIQAKEIDEINILQASLKAMKESIIKSRKKVDALYLIDGNKIPKMNYKQIDLVSLIKGDQKSSLIGLAAIIAKEYRDELMKIYDVKYPEYGFAKHSGYPTKKHREIIAQIGPCLLHRNSFKGVSVYL